MSETLAQTRKFKMHPDLLFSVIQAQAGTAEKAILEAVMNAVDAGASKCEVTINETGFVIKDDGKGFSSETEVSEFFETFGTPHKEGDAVYGRFRMGRGQMFAFATTVWRTGTFEMSVDIKNKGLDYTFNENLPFEKGCTIVGAWYEKVSSNQLFSLLKELEKLIKYMQIPVVVNNKNLVTPVSSVKWTHQEPDFSIKVSNALSTLSVYNLGALVAQYPASRFGVGGTVVTNIALKVNFARNDVLVAQCPVWKKIAKKLNEILGQETVKKSVLTQAEREALLDAVLSFETPLYEVVSKGLLTDISAKKFSFTSLLNSARVSVESGSRTTKKKEERVHDSKQALVLARSVLDAFQVESLKEFAIKINELIKYSNQQLDAQIAISQGTIRHKLYTKRISNFAADLVDIKKLTANISNDMKVKAAADLDKKEKAFLGALEAASKIISQAICSKNWSYGSTSTYREDLLKTQRKIYLGQSDVAQAWTDGTTMIAVNTNMIGQAPLKIINVLLHEYCHTESNMESHDHPSEFYELYHEMSTTYARNVEYALSTFMRSYNKLCLKAGIRPSRNFDTLLEAFELIETEEESAVEPKSTVD